LIELPGLGKASGLDYEALKRIVELSELAQMMYMELVIRRFL